MESCTGVPASVGESCRSFFDWNSPDKESWCDHCKRYILPRVLSFLIGKRQKKKRGETTHKSTYLCLTVLFPFFRADQRELRSHFDWNSDQEASEAYVKHGFDDKHDQDTSINSVSTGKAVKSFLDQGRFSRVQEGERERE